MKARILSKLDAARWLGISQPTLSNYLRDGRIKPHSIIGSGRHARIDIVQAVVDLKRTLDEERMLLPHRRVRLSIDPPADWDSPSR